MTEALGFEISLSIGFERAVAATRDALKGEGFGVLTEIDLQAAFKEKLGRDFRPYIILGACNPPLAFAAITAEPAIGLLLPCNVTVEALENGHSLVRVTDPQALLSAAPGGLSEALKAVAADAHGRIINVVDAIRRVARTVT